MSSALTSSPLASSPMTSPLLTSPFEVTLQKAASSGLDDSVEPLTQLARRMSLEADLYSRQRVDPKWRSISLGEPGASIMHVRFLGFFGTAQRISVSVTRRRCIVLHDTLCAHVRMSGPCLNDAVFHL